MSPVCTQLPVTSFQLPALDLQGRRQTSRRPLAGLPKTFRVAKSACTRASRACRNPMRGHVAIKCCARPCQCRLTSRKGRDGAPTKTSGGSCGTPWDRPTNLSMICFSPGISAPAGARLFEADGRCRRSPADAERAGSATDGVDSRRGARPSRAGSWKLATGSFGGPCQ